MPRPLPWSNAWSAKSGEPTDAVSLEHALALAKFVAQAGGRINAGSGLSKFYQVHPEARLALRSGVKAFCESYPSLLRFDQNHILCNAQPGQHRSNGSFQPEWPRHVQDKEALLANALSQFVSSHGGRIRPSRIQAFCDRVIEARSYLSQGLKTFCDRHSDCLRFEYDGGAGFIVSVQKGTQATPPRSTAVNDSVAPPTRSPQKMLLLDSRDQVTTTHGKKESQDADLVYHTFALGDSTGFRSDVQEVGASPLPACKQASSRICDNSASPVPKYAHESRPKHLEESQFSSLVANGNQRIHMPSTVSEQEKLSTSDCIASSEQSSPAMDPSLSDARDGDVGTMAGCCAANSKLTSLPTGEDKQLVIVATVSEPHDKSNISNGSNGPDDHRCRRSSPSNFLGSDVMGIQNAVSDCLYSFQSGVAAGHDVCRKETDGNCSLETNLQQEDGHSNSESVNSLSSPLEAHLEVIDAEIKALRAHALARDAQMASREALLVARETRIDEREVLLSLREATVHMKEAALADRDQKLAKGSDVTQAVAIADREAAVAKREALLANREAQLASNAAQLLKQRTPAWIYTWPKIEQDAM